MGFDADWEEYQLLQNVKEARVSRGMTQLDLGSAADIAKNTVSRMEIGLNRPSLKTFLSVINALGYKVQLTKLKDTKEE